MKFADNILKNNRLNPWLYPLILSATTVLLYANTFSGEFIYDDYSVVVNNAAIRHWHVWDLLEFWGRSVRTLSLMLDYHLFGLSPAGYHIQNIFWHLLSVLLTYFIVVKLSGDRMSSFLAALLFTVHPIHVEAVANIANRKEALCMSFSLISFLAYIRSVEEITRKRWFWMVGSFLSWYLAFNSKQVAIILPLTLVVYEMIFLKPEKRFLTRNVYILVFSLICMAGLLAWLVFTTEVYKAGYRGDISLFSVLITIPSILLTYIKIMLYPLNLSPDHIIKLYSSIADPNIALPFIICFSLVVISLYLVKSEPLISFGFFWFIIHFIPISNIVPSTYFFAERYMYIPSMGICIIQSIAIKKLFSKSGAVSEISRVFLVTAIVLYSIITVNYNAVWSKESSLWEHAIKTSPNSFIAHYNRGNIYKKMHKDKDAIRDYSKAISLNPQFAVAFTNRAEVFSSLQNNQGALKDYSVVIQLDPKNGVAYYNRGRIYYQMGYIDMAIRDYTRAIENDPLLSKAYYNRGVSHIGTGNYTQAIKDYNSAIEINPDYARAYYNLALIYEEFGEINKAEHYYLRAIALDTTLAK